MFGTELGKSKEGQKQRGKYKEISKSAHAPSAYGFNSKGHRAQGQVNAPRKFNGGEAKAAFKAASAMVRLGAEWRAISDSLVSLSCVLPSLPPSPTRTPGRQQQVGARK